MSLMALWAKRSQIALCIPIHALLIMCSRLGLTGVQLLLDVRPASDSAQRVPGPDHFQHLTFTIGERGILAIKAVSDGLDDDLSPVLGGFDIINIPHIAMRVPTNPNTWPPAARLPHHSYSFGHEPRSWRLGDACAIERECVRAQRSVNTSS